MNLKEQLLAAKKAYNEMIDEKRSLLEDADKNTADKNISEVRSKVEEIQKRMKAKEAEIKDLEALIEEAKNSRSGFNINPENPEPEGEDEAEKQYRMANHYLHTRDAQSAGLKSPDAALTIPKDVKYVPVDEVKTIDDLSQYIHMVNVTSAQGSYPVRPKPNTTSLHSVEELAKNPDLAKPSFKNIEWKVDTYRGAIPLSQEAIDDSDADLVSIVYQDLKEQKILLLNDKILNVMKTFTAKTVSSVDELKAIKNVALDPGYKHKVMVVSASFYQWLDTLKDKDDNYILNRSITANSPDICLGLPVFTVRDTTLGQAGEMKAFIGDIFEGIFGANRKDLQARWVDDSVYGQFLQGVTRFGITKSDEDAGFFVTATPSKAS